MKSKIRLFLALATVLVIAGVIGYYVLDGRVSPVGLVLSLVTGDDQSESEARKAGKELESAATAGDVRKAQQAVVAMLPALGKSMESDPSGDKEAELLRGVVKAYGRSLVAGGKKFLSPEEFAELAPKVSASQVAATAVATTEKTRPAAVLVPGGAGMVAAVTDDCYLQLVAGPNTVSRDCKVQLETVLARTGGEVVVPPIPAMPVPEPQVPVERSDVRQVAEMQTFDACADLPPVGSRTRTDEVGKLNFLKARGLLNSEQAERLNCFARSYRERMRTASAVRASRAKAR